MWKNIPYKGYVYFSFAINVLSILIILAWKTFLPPVVPLCYGLPSGGEQLTPSLGLITVPAIGIVVVLLNIFVCRFTKDLFLKKTLIISSAFVSFLLTVAVLKIILLVGFF